MEKEETLSRLRWQCRRGLLELDILLGNFLETHYLQLSEKEKILFNDLLQCSDQDLLYWFTNQAVPPAAFKNIITEISFSAQ
jgi:antitoxin CptB